ncbi:hypothetical protein BDZ97DRAFT_1915985 [Flammula alnicola]|nr:hypothetical protein BDZ97DRAFT_1915985 [Flammula alnicola]
MSASPPYSSEISFATAMTTPRATSPPIVQESDMSNAASPRTGDQVLPSGIYRIVSDHDPNSAIDLSGYDKKSIIAYGGHDGENQKWEFTRLGPGFSIRSLFNGAYITLESGIIEGATMIASAYPVSWAVEVDDFEAGIYRIRWPNSPFIFDWPEGTGHIVQLCNRYPFKTTRLWRLVPVKSDAHLKRMKSDTLEFTTSMPQKLKPEPPLITTADTVIDVEGLKLGGNGEMSITTTTTTVTTSVTVVKRLGTP